MTIIPDNKDWTWVLYRPCPECGLDTSSFAREQIAGMIVANALAWQRVLTGPEEIRTRPAPDRWSALEYGCHVRDVLRLYDHRLELMLSCSPTGTRTPPRSPNATANSIPSRSPPS
jgi:hypothetical protein